MAWDKPGTYSVGEDFVINSGAGLTTFTGTNADEEFRTFVDTPLTTVPEPSTSSLLGIALAALGLAWRRARHVA